MKALTQTKISTLYAVLLLSLLSSCQKIDEWLDKKSALNEVRPSTLTDFQAILDNNGWLNNVYPVAGSLGVDNFYLTDQRLNALSAYERNCYLFEKEIYTTVTDGREWDETYRVIEFANIALDGIATLPEGSNTVAYNNVKGSALFFRAFAYYMLSQIYCEPFDPTTDNSGLGMILRTSSDVNKPSVRSTIAQTYEFMIHDLEQAIELLPPSSPYQTRPTRPAANALLAKIYLSMENYNDAYTYSNKCLSEFNTLLDYNSELISINSSFRFPVMPSNPEVIFYARQRGASTLSVGGGGAANVDTILYDSYKDNDLRKSLYYLENEDGIVKIAGNYSADYYQFCGIATNEVLLIRAECLARLGNSSDAIEDLNSLLIKRFLSNDFNPYDDNMVAEDALKVIIEERRKELAFTGQLRWEDLRRLNKDERFAKTIERHNNETIYTLPPNDKRYVYPIPDNEIELSGIKQNER